jgi:hypothetical protein
VREGPSWARIDNVLLPVFVVSWQIECCGQPLAVDQGVRWQLLFSEAGRWHGEPEPYEHEVTLTGQAEPFVWELGEPDRANVRLRVGSAVLYWSAPEVVAGAVTVTGPCKRIITPVFPRTSLLPRERCDGSASRAVTSERTRHGLERGCMPGRARHIAT